MASANPIADSLSFRLVRFGVSAAWFMLLFGVLINGFFLVIFVVTGGETAPSYDRGGFNIGGKNSPFKVGTVMELPIHVDYFYEGDANWLKSPLPFSEDQEAGNSVLVDGFGTTRVRIQDNYGLAVSAAMTALWSFLAMWIVYHVRDVLDSIRDGEPFSRENVRRLRKIGVALLVYAPVKALLYFYTALRYLDRVSVTDARADVDVVFHFDIIAVGLVILIVAQLIDVGARVYEERDRLEYEQELTV